MRKCPSGGEGCNIYLLQTLAAPTSGWYGPIQTRLLRDRQGAFLAALTPLTTGTAESKTQPALQALNLRFIAFSSVADGDTWTAPTSLGIKRVAVLQAVSTPIGASLVAATGVVTFSDPGATAPAVSLLIWGSL